MKEAELYQSTFPIHRVLSGSVTSDGSGAASELKNVARKQFITGYYKFSI
jgi:hypothetical protein